MPILVVTPLEKGGLNQITRRLFTFWCLGCLCAVSALGLQYDRVCEYPLALRAAWYWGDAAWKSASVDEISDSRLLIEIGSCLITVGGVVGFGVDI